MGLPQGRVAVVVKGYPRLSETFIAQEILGLERRGLEVLIVSLRRPTDRHVHDLHREIAAQVLYLPEYLKDDPPRVAAARRAAEGMAGFPAARAAYEADLAADRSASRHRRFGQACVLAAELPADVRHLHVHYLHTPASVTRYAAKLTGLPWSFSAHAKDIWTTPEAELAVKVDDAAWGATCTAVNAAYLRGLSRRPEAIDLVYHGLDLSRFPAPPARAPARGRPVRVLSVCRAVEKKGLDDVIAALSRLSGRVDFTFEHVGGGALVERLKRRAEAAGIGGRVRFLGALPRDGVIEALGRADVFVLASRIARSGDRDGLPNVLMEAAAMGLPVVATRVSAIPEAVEDGVTGLLVEPRDRKALADAIARLATDGALRRRMGEAAARAARARFSPDPGLDRLIERFSTPAREAAA